MLVPLAVRDGFIAGNNAAGAELLTVPVGVEPIGSFTDPEYAKVGLTEEQAPRSATRLCLSRYTLKRRARSSMAARADSASL